MPREQNDLFRRYDETNLDQGQNPAGMIALEEKLGQYAEGGFCVLSLFIIFQIERDGEFWIREKRYIVDTDAWKPSEHESNTLLERVRILGGISGARESR